MNTSSLKPLFLLILFLVVILGQSAEAQSLASPALADSATQTVIDKYLTLIPQEMRKQPRPRR
jgi:hypothetical protein